MNGDAFCFLNKAIRFGETPHKKKLVAKEKCLKLKVA